MCVCVCVCVWGNVCVGVCVCVCGCYHLIMWLSVTMSVLGEDIHRVDAKVSEERFLQVLCRGKSHGS